MSAHTILAKYIFFIYNPESEVSMAQPENPPATVISTEPVDGIRVLAAIPKLLTPDAQQVVAEAQRARLFGHIRLDVYGGQTVIEAFNPD